MVTALPMAPAIRFHMSLEVSNLERSLAFYRNLFGREPAKCRRDYAKFEMDIPPSKTHSVLTEAVRKLSSECAGNGSVP